MWQLMAFQLVHPTQVDALWPYVAPLVQKAVDKQGLGTPIIDYHTMCRNGACYLFVWEGDGIEAAMVVESIYDVKGQAAVITALGTHRKMTWPDDITPVFDWIKYEHNIDRVFAKGRLGWARTFKKAKVISQTYEMEL